MVRTLQGAEKMTEQTVAWIFIGVVLIFSLLAIVISFKDAKGAGKI